ncbi:MAG: Uma2 family endonuclease [Saprospiraceae bacterium]|nr:Uma2 family endonuclease [Saprospiraceae bacterium]
MEALAAPTRSKRMPKIPDSLIWEVLDGQPLYRRGYMDVVRKQKTITDIMGTSSYQSIIITYLSKLLARHLDDAQYDYLINEIGIHLKHRDNISNDIAIFNRLNGEQFSKKYVDFPPKIAIEIDIDIDPSSMSHIDYLNTKTQKMLDFGVEKVIWILTNNKKVMVAVPNAPWLTMEWTNDIEIIDGITFNIHNYLVERNIQIS